MINRALDEGFSLGDTRVYPLDFTMISSSGEELQLSPIGMQVLCELAQAGGKPVTTEHLINQVWGHTTPDEGTLEHYIAELVHKFDPESDQESLIISDVEGLYNLSIVPESIDSDTTKDNLQSAAKQKSGFFDELRKRKVSQTGVLYLVVSWLILQFTDVAFEALGLGDGLIRLILITVVIGFPITLVLSWFYDVKRSDEIETSQPTSRRAGYVFFGGLIALPIAFAYQWFYSGDIDFTESSYETIATYKPKPNSIAVLAFENLGGDDNYDYFGDGIAEEILNALSSTGKMLVAPRTSSFLYKNNSISAKDIGRQLGVRYVLEGSVRRIGGRVRVIAKLVNVSSGFQIWSNPYDQELSGIFDVQQDISKQVVQSLNIVLSTEKNETLGMPRTSSIEAYDYYLQGRDYLNRPATKSYLESAVGLFEKSIEKDSQYVDAYAGLCESYLEQYKETGSTDWFNKAENSCQDALRFNQPTVDVRVALGNLYRHSGVYERSLLQLRIALEKDPDNINALSALAKTNAKSDDNVRAETLFRRAIDIQPRNWRAQEELGTFLLETGRPTQAIKHYQKTIELTPDNAAAYNNLGAALLMSNNFEAAAEAWKKSLAIEDNESASSNAGSALFMAGKFDEAAAMYSRATKIAKHKHVLWGNLADAQRFGSQPELAIDSYKQAARLAEESLKINSSSARTAAMLGHYYSNIDEINLAIEMLERATQNDPKDFNVWYYAALTWLTLDKKNSAAQSLQRAIELGYPTEMVSYDAGLRSLTAVSSYRDQLGL